MMWEFRSYREPCWRRALPEHPNLNHEDAKDTKVHGGGAWTGSVLCRPSRSQIIQKFFGSFFQKRTERKHFFFEKKKQKTFSNGASVYGLIDSLVLGVALNGFDLRDQQRIK